MARRRLIDSSSEMPDNKRVHRYWVELHDRRDGSVRKLPLRAIRRVDLVTKKGVAQLPDEDVLQLEDGDRLLEVKSLEELRTRLRDRYPNEHFDRFLRQERDVEAERRKAEAMEGLMQLLVEAVVRDLERVPAESAAGELRLRVAGRSASGT